MRTVTITVGLPASGKTTWSKKMLQDNPGKYKRINKDDLRSMLDNNLYTIENERFVLIIRDILIEQSLRDGYSIIVDDTNLNKKHHRVIQNIVDRYNFDTSNKVSLEIKFFDTHVNECIVRDAKRINGVGEKVINDMYNRYNNIYNFDGIDAIVQDVSKPETIIVDIDGTIATRVNRSPFDWESVDTDLPKKEIIDIVRMFISNGKDVIFLSGRDSCCYDDTLAWIKYHVYYEPLNERESTNDIKLYMRAEGDMRRDSIVKKELFMEHIHNKYYITHVFDDRNSVVNVWRSMGLTCLQVAQGNF